MSWIRSKLILMLSLALVYSPAVFSDGTAASAPIPCPIQELLANLTMKWMELEVSIEGSAKKTKFSRDGASLSRDFIERLSKRIGGGKKIKLEFTDLRDDMRDYGKEHCLGIEFTADSVEVRNSDGSVASSELTEALLRQKIEEIEGELARKRGELIGSGADQYAPGGMDGKVKFPQKKGTKRISDSEREEIEVDQGDEEKGINFSGLTANPTTLACGAKAVLGGFISYRHGYAIIKKLYRKVNGSWQQVHESLRESHFIEVRISVTGEAWCLEKCCSTGTGDGSGGGGAGDDGGSGDGGTRTGFVIPGNQTAVALNVGGVTLTNDSSQPASAVLLVGSGEDVKKCLLGSEASDVMNMNLLTLVMTSNISNARVYSPLSGSGVCAIAKGWNGVPAADFNTQLLAGANFEADSYYLSIPSGSPTQAADIRLTSYSADGTREGSLQGFVVNIPANSSKVLDLYVDVTGVRSGEEDASLDFSIAVPPSADVTLSETLAVSEDTSRTPAAAAQNPIIIPGAITISTQSNPASGMLVRGSDVTLLKLKITAGQPEDIDLSRLTLWLDGKQINSTSTADTAGNVEFKLEEDLFIPVGDTIKLDLKADIFGGVKVKAGSAENIRINYMLADPEETADFIFRDVPANVSLQVDPSGSSFYTMAHVALPTELTRLIGTPFKMVVKCNDSYVEQSSLSGNLSVSSGKIQAWTSLSLGSFYDSSSVTITLKLDEVDIATYTKNPKVQSPPETTNFGVGYADSPVGGGGGGGNPPPPPPPGGGGFFILPPLPRNITCAHEIQNYSLSATPTPECTAARAAFLRCVGDNAASVLGSGGLHPTPPACNQEAIDICNDC